MKINLDKDNLVKVLWLTGLSGSGKTTLANAVAKEIFNYTNRVKILDGDDLRKGLNNNLGFSIEDRLENIRRAAEVSKLFFDSNIFTICSFITPLDQMRQLAKQIIGKEHYIEIYVKCSLEECERRDVKGLYKKVRSGSVSNFTGISSEFETPTSPSIIVDTEKDSVEECVRQILEAIF